MFFPSNLMINFISHTEYHWLSGSLCTHKWTCCLLTWHFLEFSTVVVEQGSWISFKNAKAQRNWRLNVNGDYQRKSQELHWYEAVGGAIVACAVSGTFSADVWNYSRYMKLKEDMTVCRSIILLSSHLHISSIQSEMSNAPGDFAIGSRHTLLCG